MDEVKEKCDVARQSLKTNESIAVVRCNVECKADNEFCSYVSLMPVCDDNNIKFNESIVNYCVRVNDVGLAYSHMKSLLMALTGNYDESFDPSEYNACVVVAIADNIRFRIQKIEDYIAERNGKEMC